ncbi:MAG TPA: AAA family ATPase, partial [Candidatus Hydrogenedentes bacterium]|nr:AAA family ATPase [Candidatus Hydrogenedentota bacterium]
MEIPGIGEKKTETIAKAWKEQTAVTEIMVFLSGCGITPAYATKIYRQYGLDAIRIIQQNPYQLSYDVAGIGFLVSDRIAQKNGISRNSPRRIEAGSLYALEEGKKEGHCYYPEPVLRSRAAKLLEVDEQMIGDAINSLMLAQRIVVEKVDGQNHIYTPMLYKHETESARLLAQKMMSLSPYHGRMGNISRLIDQAEEKFKVRLSTDQRSAVLRACTNTISVLTGGPGTGKTLTTKVIVEIFKQKDATVLLAAPTGKAAKRLSGCGHEASTIHRLLEFSPAINGFVRNAENPLECDVLILDEMSMTDISLFYYLMRAVPLGAHVIVIGDADQLPSVSPGALMRHLVESGLLSLTVLQRIFRQDEGSGIVQIAHCINEGIIPREAHFGKDCYFVTQEDPAQAAARAVEIVKKLESQGREVQVLSPIHKGDAGTTRLNELMQEELNPVPPGETETYQVIRGFRKFRINDKVIQTKNDYEKMVFNGDSGVITDIDHEEQTLDVLFEGRGIVKYDFLDIDQLLLSRCLSVHKSQGSEYEVVVVLCLKAHY